MRDIIGKECFIVVPRGKLTSEKYAGKAVRIVERGGLTLVQFDGIKILWPLEKVLAI